MERALTQPIDLENEATTLVIVRLILQSFVTQSPQMGRPWSWSTNDGAMAERVIGAMRRLGVDEAHMDMPVASNEQNASCDEDWAGFMRQLGALVS
jgi:hypothetical protein